MDFNYIDEIKRDAVKLTERRFKESEEDFGWTPTPYSTPEEAARAAAQAEKGDEPSIDWSLKDLQNHAASLGIQEVNKLNSKAKALDAIAQAEKGDEQ